MPQLGLGLGLHRANRALFRGLLDQYGGAAAAYSLRALSSGWLAGDVVEVRPSSGWTSASFTANQVANGEMVDYVKRPGNFTNSGYDTLSNNGDGDGFTATTGTSNGFASSSTVSGVSTDEVTITFDLSIVSGSPALYLRQAISQSSDIYVFSTSGSKSQTLTATSSFDNFVFSEADDGAEWTISNVRVSTNDGFVSTWYDQSGNANNATQITTTSQPKIVSAGALVVGGLDFDGVDDELGADGLSADFQSKSYAAIFAVAKYDSTASATEPVFFAQAGAATGSARVFVGKVGTNFVSAGRRLDTDSFVQSTFASSTSSVLLTSMDQWADGDTQLVVNGSEKTAANYSSGAGVTSNTTSDVVTIGSLASNFMGGAINELIIYNSDQSANRAAIEANINAAYSIY
jgi:hypothetical protein